MEIKWFHCLYLLPSRHNDSVITSLQHCFDVNIWLWNVMETSDNVAKTTSLERFCMTSFNESLQQRCFCNVVRCFHHYYMATLEWRRIAISQRLCNDVVVSTTTRQLQVTSWKFNKWCHLILRQHFKQEPTLIPDSH